MISFGLASALPAPAATSDDFSSVDLDTARWSLVDPGNGAIVDQFGGLLAIAVPGGRDHGYGLDQDTSIRLLQAQADADFSIETKFESLPDQPGQFQGILAAGEDRHDIRWECRATADGIRLEARVCRGGLVQVKAQVDLPLQTLLFLRLERVGDTWIVSDSLDGFLWNERGRFDHDLAVTGVGIACGTMGADGGHTDRDREDSPPVGLKTADRPAPPLSVLADYFFDGDDPIEVEDGEVFWTGERTFDGLQALYLFRAGGGGTIHDLAPGLPPLNLEIADPGAVSWLPDGGLILDAPTVARSPGPADKITTACRTSGEVTLEAWVHPQTTQQSGPARILTVSGDPSTRNATLAHGLWGSLPSDVFDVRLRTTMTSDNGQPETWTPAGSLTGNRQHVVMTFAAGTTRIFVDGVEIASQFVDGTLDGWDTDYPLALGAEVDDSRHWLGVLHLAAIYDRALTPAEITGNYRAGPEGGDLPDLAPSTALQGIQPGDLFTFEDVVALEAVAFDPDGTLERVEFLVDDQVVFVDDMPPYRFDWNQPTVGSHVIRAVGVDDLGLRGESASVPILVVAPSSFLSSIFQSDDFRGLTLDPYWLVDDGTSGTVLTEAGGHHLADLPDGTGDPWDSSAPDVFVHQTEIDVDLGLEVKLAAADFRGEGWGGLRVVDSTGEGVQVIGRRGGGIWTVEWTASAGPGFGTWQFTVVDDVDEGLWLQARRTGQAWTFLSSVDGLHWNEHGTTVVPFVPAASGWVAGRLADGGPCRVAVDYAFNLASPINDEDGGGGGDQTPPVIEDLQIAPELDRVTFRWTTDEPAFTRLAYGLTPAHEMGTLVSGAFTTDHRFDIEGLTEGTPYHYSITAIDPAGNVTNTGDRVFWTDIVPVESAGPAAGDVYRETVLVIGKNSDEWRVTDPDATNPGAAAFLPNPVLTLDLPDLTGAVRAELILDRWGGHPGTSDKRVRFNGTSWLHLSEPPIPDTKPECFVYQDNPMIEIPLDQLQTGANTLEGTAGGQTCNDFGWGQWSWYGAVVRIYYADGSGAPTGTILQPLAGETLSGTATVEVDAAAPGGVDQVVVLGRYEGWDEDGDGVFSEWHRTYRRDYQANEVRLLGTVGVLDAAPWTVDWDLEWIPEQAPGSIQLQARIRGADGLWRVTDFVTGLTIDQPDGPVHMYPLEDVPRMFWVRTNQVMSATFSIPPGHDLALAGSARLVAHTWNGSDAGVLDLNDGAWWTDSVGDNHFWQRDEYVVPSATFLSGTNTLTIAASTEHHGMEVLWPGPMVMIQYGGTAPASVGAPPEFTWDDPRRDEDGLVIPLRIEGSASAEIRVELQGDSPGLLGGISVPDAKSGAVEWTVTDGALVATARAGDLAGEGLGVRVVPDPARETTVTGRVILADGTVLSLAPVTVPAVPARFDLRPNHPNPFNPQTRITFALPVNARVDLGVYDIQGRRVRTLVDTELPFGVHHVDWDGRDDAGRGVASGTYLYRMRAGGFGATGKMLLVR